MRTGTATKFNPGYCTDNELERVEGCYENFANFILEHGGWNGKIVDIGKDNPKRRFLEKYLEVEIETVDYSDFNFDVINFEADCILCFEVIEHLQNPLWFMKQLAQNMKSDTILYLSTPNRPQVMRWNPRHFREYKPQELIDWLLNPASLRVENMAKIEALKIKWVSFLTGIRPLIRIIPQFLWGGKTQIYKIVKDIDTFLE